MKRILTALVLVPFAVYSALFAPWWFFVAAVALNAVFCFHEYAKITASFAPLGFVVGLLILVANPQETMLLLFLTALASMCLPLAAPDLETATIRSGTLILGIIYTFGGWKTAILLHDIDAPAVPHLSAGRCWLMFALLVNWIGDTGAYYVGRGIGRHKLAPLVSPGKTWEGSLASVAAAVVFALVYLPWAIPGTSFLKAALLGLAANVAGQFGDLAESAVKRGAGVKDSGALLPGHGGMLDRVDSSLFSLPVVYALVTLTGHPLN